MVGYRVLCGNSIFNFPQTLPFWSAKNLMFFVTYMENFLLYSRLGYRRALRCASFLAEPEPHHFWYSQSRIIWHTLEQHHFNRTNAASFL
jgi:hypothetical protein